MGITMRKNDFARDRAVMTESMKKEPFDWWAVMDIIWPIAVILWWGIKIPSFIIFVFAMAGILGALFNNNPPQGHDIAWAIISFFAFWIL